MDRVCGIMIRIPRYKITTLKDLECTLNLRIFSLRYIYSLGNGVSLIRLATERRIYVIDSCVLDTHFKTGIVVISN